MGGASEASFLYSEDERGRICCSLLVPSLTKLGCSHPPHWDKATTKRDEACSSLLLRGCDKTPGESSLGARGFVWYTGSSSSLGTEVGSRNHRGTPLTGLLLLACSRTLGIAPPGLDPPTPISNHKNGSQKCPQASLWRQSLR